MSMFGIGAFRATLGLDSSDYTKSIVSAGTATNTFGQTITTAMVNPMLGAVSALKQAATASIRFGQQVLADAEAVQRAADSTGLMVETIQALQQEADLAHGSMQFMTAGLNDFSKAIGSARTGIGPSGQMLQQIIGPIDQWDRADDALRAVIGRLLEMDEASRRRVGQEIFGSNAAQMLNTIEASGTSIDGLISKYERLGLVTERDVIDNLANLNTSLGTTQKAFDGLLTQGTIAFLDGFSGGAGEGARSMEDMIVQLQSLLPLIRDLGSVSADAARSITDLANNEVIDGLRTMISIIEPIREGLVGIATQLTTPLFLDEGGRREQGYRFAEMNRENQQIGMGLFN